MPAPTLRREIHVKHLEIYLETMCAQPYSRYLCLIFYIDDVYTTPAQRNAHFMYTAERKDEKENITLILHIFFTV